MRKIQLTKGMFAKVDDADFEWLSEHKWTASHHGRNGVDKWYAVTGTPKPEGSKRRKAMPHTRMHRLILGIEFGDKRVVHHIDDDSLNNQRNNLEIVENNAANMAKCRNWRGR